MSFCAASHPEQLTREVMGPRNDDIVLEMITDEKEWEWKGTQKKPSKESGGTVILS